jgi:hypothetical protein
MSQTLPPTAGAAEAPSPAAPAPAPAAAAPAEGVPATYTLHLPEGAPVDQPLLAAYTAALRHAGLTQAQADKLTPFLAEQLQAIRAEAARAREQTAQKWQAEVAADPEIGGPRWQASQAAAARALDAFGGPKLPKALNATGAGNHPDIVRAFVAIGRALGEEGAPLQPDRSGAGPADRSFEAIAARLYPGMGNR